MKGGTLQISFLYIVLVALLVLAFFVLRPFLVPLSLAGVFATVLYPLYRAVLKREIKSRNLAAFAVTLFGLLILLAPITFVGSRLAKEAQGLYTMLTSDNGSQYLSGVIGQVYQWSGQTGGPTSLDISAEVTSYARQTISWIIQNIGGAFSSAASFSIEIIIFIMSLFFMLRDGEAFKRKIVSLSPLRDSDDELVFTYLKQAINSVVRGSLFVAVIQGFLTGLGFTLFGVPNSILWGTVAMLAALIPGFGTSLVLIPGILFLFLGGHTGAGVGLLLWGALGVGLIDNFIGPKLMGSGMHMHQLLILLFVLGGISLFGPAGIFLGPLCLSLLFAFLSIYSDSRMIATSVVGKTGE